jgi:hypothetical protein
LQAIAEPFLDGPMEDEVQPWISSADRWRGVLCESTMTQVFESAPRPTTSDAFFVELAWPLVVEHGIDWLIRAATISAKSPDDDSEGDYFEVGSGHRVGHKLQNAIVRLAAEAVVHAPSENWVNNIVQKCLTLPGKRHGAREGFASWFAAYSMGDSNDELPEKAVTRWSSFAETVLDLDESNSEADELPKAALGLSLLSQYSWPQQATQAAIALSPYFERWIKSARRDVRDAAVFAYFLSRPAAEPLRQNGIEWLASNPRFIEPQQWRHESDRQPLLNLLESVAKGVSLGQQSSQLRNAIIKLLAATAAASDARAVDLQRSLGIID